MTTVLNPPVLLHDADDEGASGTLARVRGLSVRFGEGATAMTAVHDMSFDLVAGRCVALVGESGSGKSVTARTLVGLTGGNAHVEAEELTLFGRDGQSLTQRQWRGVRGRRVGFILQDAMVSLDPLRKIGREIEESLRIHGWGTRRSRRDRVIELLRSVGVPDPERRVHQRPDQLSGGLRQRALIAAAVALAPDVVIADEPTTALDVSIQAQVLDELAAMKARGVSLLVISHDLSVVARLADEVLVMRNGEVVERGEVADVMHRPQHPYTQQLIAAVPSVRTRGRSLDRSGTLRSGVARLTTPRHEPPRDERTVLTVRGVSKTFRIPGGSDIKAVDDVSFEVPRGSTIGIVGESASGKSTTGRIVLGLEKPDAGEVLLAGEAWSAIREGERRPRRRNMAVVYQDPLSSFDPRWNVERILLDAIDPDEDASPTSRLEAVKTLLDAVGLPQESVLQRFPLTLSGGQRQRVAIARALASSPALVVLDEAVSALDVSIQAQILDLLAELQRANGTSYLFISHDLGVISHMCDEVLVMKDGVVVERGGVHDVFERPQHPYTQQLVQALPRATGPLDRSPT
jgi:peptide/nickel transport system ATP-binding protein